MSDGDEREGDGEKVKHWRNISREGVRKLSCVVTHCDRLCPELDQRPAGVSDEEIAAVSLEQPEGIFIPQILEA